MAERLTENMKYQYRVGDTVGWCPAGRQAEEFYYTGKVTNKDNESISVYWVRTRKAINQGYPNDHQERIANNLVTTYEQLYGMKPINKRKIIICL